RRILSPLWQGGAATSQCARNRAIGVFHADSVPLPAEMGLLISPYAPDAMTVVNMAGGRKRWLFSAR
ncbi:hypothetical protein LZC13_10355, partial [Campylobacter coli]|nr:hypothetical protein [Campylobacter coli]